MAAIAAPEPQHEGEQRLLEEWRTGGVVHLCGAIGESCQPVDHSDADTWGEDRTIGGAFLRGLLLYLLGQEVDPQGLRIHGARIVGELDLSWVTLPWPLALFECNLSDPFVAEAATMIGLDLTGAHLPELVATGLHARQVVLDKVQCSRNVVLNGCRVQGSLFARNATFGTPKGIQTDGVDDDSALDLHLSHIEGDVHLRDTTCWGGLVLLGASLGGQLGCRASTFISPDGTALKADQAHITGGVFLVGGFRAEGVVRFLGATIGGQLTCRDARFINPNGHALSADKAQITGDVFLDEGFAAVGEVRFPGATLGGQLDCRAGTFTNPNADALSADQAHITGGVFLNEGFRAEGTVRLLGATIGGQIDCHAGTFTNPDGDALSADVAQVTGSVFLDEGFAANGGVRFRGARIEQSVVATGSFDKGSAGYALALERAVIGRSLSLAPTKITGIVDLTDCATGTFRDRLGAWPNLMHLEGFTYRHIEGAGVDESQRISWLARHCDANGKPAFSPRSYEQLAAVYRTNGEDRRARKVGIARARAARRHMPRWAVHRRAWSLLLGATVGHGYRPSIALLWLAGSWLALWQAIRHADSLGLMRPLASDPARVPPLARSVYALDVLVPVVDLGQRNYWQPEWPWSIAVWVGVIVGWTLVTAVVAGLTSAFRRS